SWGCSRDWSWSDCKLRCSNTLKSWLSWLLRGESDVSVKLCNHPEHRHHALLHLLELSVYPLRNSVNKPDKALLGCSTLSGSLPLNGCSTLSGSLHYIKRLVSEDV